jgi:putative heme-binding domain-containing protein
MALTPPGYKAGDGVFVASKGKASLLLDSGHTGKADKEVVVASGWKEIPHGVDAIGAAVDKDGNVYFGLGATDYTNPYLLDKDGKAHYDLKSERGTVLKVSPDFSKREIVCTGVRFTVGLGFNRDGELFATDQEGATWLANGNPLDELLHIQPGRHYGFPPRHPKHLPDVIDEPSVFDYGPQHQSTCGLCFNDPVNGGPTFGPAAWDGNAFVAGYSRGKLYRTELVKTPAGYVARTQVLACLNMLAVDACLSPKGEMVVAVHSGQPDWGSGPTGRGKLYKIVYSDKERPQPVLAWAAGPREVRVAFDRPLEPGALKGLAAGSSVEYGRYVRPGDRFESLRPGYAAVAAQLAAPRFALPVYAADVTPDRRTLVLATAPQPEAASYALTLPGLGRPEGPNKAAGELPQVPAVDLGYDLCGVAAAWRPADGGEAREEWLPHPDLDVSRAFTKGSAEHDAFWQGAANAGTLTLRCQLDLWQMLRPAVQPGSTLDYTLPPEEATLVFESAAPLEVKVAGAAAKEVKGEDGGRQLRAAVKPREGEPLPVEATLTTGKGPPALRVWYFTNEDPRPRALPLGRILQPWASVKRNPPEAAGPRRIPELKGGDWARGREAFFGDQALCSRCHKVNGEGGALGPDLSNLVHRDYASVLRDVRDPNATIHPDYLTYLVELVDGRALVGVVRTEGDKVVVGDAGGKEYAVPKRLVESMTPSKVSAMPEGLDKALGPDKMRDLLTFLLSEPLRPAPPEREGAPPPRTRAEVEAALKALPASAGPYRPLRVVLAVGPKDHGPGEHDYPLFQRRWAWLLEQADGVTVEEAGPWPSPEQWKTADLVVFYSANPAWTAEKAKDLDAYLARGGGLAYVHFGVNGRAAPDALAERIGLAWKDGASRYHEHDLTLSFSDADHPVTRGFDKLPLIDEAYWNLAGDPKDLHVLATAVEDGQPRPLLWTREQGKGRVFVSIIGHYTWTFDDPLFRVLLLRGFAWAAHEPEDRLQALAWPGAAVKEGR